LTVERTKTYTLEAKVDAKSAEGLIVKVIDYDSGDAVFVFPVKLKPGNTATAPVKLYPGKYYIQLSGGPGLIASAGIK
jgi:hypothetical protein